MESASFPNVCNSVTGGSHCINWDGIKWDSVQTTHVRHLWEAGQVEAHVECRARRPSGVAL